MNEIKYKNNVVNILRNYKRTYNKLLEANNNNKKSWRIINEEIEMKMRDF